MPSSVTPIGRLTPVDGVTVGVPTMAICVSVRSTSAKVITPVSDRASPSDAVIESSAISVTSPVVIISPVPDVIIGSSFVPVTTTSKVSVVTPVSPSLTCKVYVMVTVSDAAR